MQLPPELGTAYLRHAFGQVLAVVDELGDERLNARPTAAGTNAVGALVLHRCPVCDWWLGHVARGRPTARDRDGEFIRQTSVQECHEEVAATLRQADDDLRRLDAGDGVPHGARARLPGLGDDASVVLHVVEELFQHLGQMEVTRDVLLDRGAHDQATCPREEPG